MKAIICEKEVELLGEQYIVYLKQVPARVESGGKPISTCVKAFVRKLER